MTGPSEDDLGYANYLARNLLGPEREHVELEGSLVVSDVEADAAEFEIELDLLSEVGFNVVPAVRIEEELVPVALRLAMGPSWPEYPPPSRFSRRRPPYLRNLVYAVRRLEEDGETVSGYATMPHGEARSTFLRRATNFLATRIAAVREVGRGEAFQQPSLSFLTLPQRLGGSQVRTPGCQFSISTNSSGLRVFWSGAYRVSPNYFSHPTTPTSSVLQSGTYVFGVDGGAYGSVIRWDRNAVVSLPGQPHAHLNY